MEDNFILPSQSLIKKALESSDLSQFDFKEMEIERHPCVLVTPKEMGVDWNKDNLILRSLIYRKKDYLPVSLSWPKFFNYTEQPGLYPNPDNFDISKSYIDEKIDGSTLIVSRYRGKYIIRTRGTFDVCCLPNYLELASTLREELERATNNKWVDSEGVTLLFEWQSVDNIIIIRPQKSQLFLIGAINMADYSIKSVKELEEISAAINIPRPKQFKFGSIKEIIDTCKSLKGQEGYVFSYNNNQNRVKLKGDWYLKLHRMKSAISSFNNLMDLYFDLDYPTQSSFFKYIEDTFDYELAKVAEPNIIQIDNIYTKAKYFELSILGWVERNCLFCHLSKKDAAMKILEKYSKDGLDSYAFFIHKQGKLDKKMFRKLMEKIKKDESLN